MSRLEAAMKDAATKLERYGAAVDRLEADSIRYEATRSKLVAMEAGSIQAQRDAWAASRR